MAEPEEQLVERIAGLIAEHVGVSYSLGEDGHFDPETIKVWAYGAAHAVIHELRANAGADGNG